MSKKEALTAPQEMSENEQIFGRSTISGISVGQRIDGCFKSMDEIRNLMDFHNGIDTKYWLMMKEKRIYVWFRTDAENEDVLDSMLAVSYLQSQSVEDGEESHDHI